MTCCSSAAELAEQAAVAEAAAAESEWNGWMEKFVFFSITSTLHMYPSTADAAVTAIVIQ